MTEKEELEIKVKELEQELRKNKNELNKIKAQEEKERKKTELEQLAEDKSDIKFTIMIGEHYLLFVGNVKKNFGKIMFEGISIIYSSEYYDNGENIEYHFEQLRLETIYDLEEIMENTENIGFSIIKSYSEVYSHFQYYMTQINNYLK